MENLNDKLNNDFRKQPKLENIIRYLDQLKFEYEDITSYVVIKYSCHNPRYDNREVYMRFKTYEELKEFCKKTFNVCINGEYFRDGTICNYFYTIEIHSNLLE